MRPEGPPVPNLGLRITSACDLSPVEEVWYESRDRILDLVRLALRGEPDPPSVPMRAIVLDVGVAAWRLGADPGEVRGWCERREIAAVRRGEIWLVVHPALERRIRDLAVARLRALPSEAVTDGAILRAICAVDRASEVLTEREAQS